MIDPLDDSVKPKTEKEKKEFYKQLMDKNPHLPQNNKKFNFPPPTEEQLEYMRTHDIYGNPLPK